MKTVLKILLGAYELVISPVLSGLGCRCRFNPSCSEYASDAIAVHAWWRALLLIAGRVLRCGPWHPGGVDPVAPHVRERQAI